MALTWANDIRTLEPSGVRNGAIKDSRNFYRFIPRQPILSAIIDSMYGNDSRYLRQALSAPRSIVNDARYLIQIHQKRNPELDKDLAALDVIRFLLRAAGREEDDGNFHSSLCDIPPETIRLARYAACWAYIETDDEINTMTRHAMQAIINGHTDNSGRMDHAPTPPTPPGIPRRGRKKREEEQ